MNQNIELTNDIPTESGYYLITCGEGQRPHLVHVIFEDGKKPQIISELFKNLYFNEFPNFFKWSRRIEIV